MIASFAAQDRRAAGAPQMVSDTSSGTSARPTAALVFVERSAAAACLVVAALVLALTFGPRFVSYQTFVAGDAAMAPAIGKSAVVVAQPVRPADLRVGDVITFRRPEDPQTWLTRRLVEVRPLGDLAYGAAIIATKADANPGPDPWRIELHGSAWRSVFTLPLAGYLVAIAQTSWGVTLFLLLPSAGLSLLVLERSWHGVRNAVVA